MLTTNITITCKRMHLFFSQDLSHDEVILEGEESRHCTRVLRLDSGDRVMLTDGRGGRALSEITEILKGGVKLRVKSREEGYGKRPFRLHMAVAPTKNIDRFEHFLEKATECGIDEITPIICEKSERRVVKPQRLEKILLSAMKQSLRAYLPRLNSPTGFEEFIRGTGNHSGAFIAHCGGGKRDRPEDLFIKGEDLLLLVGPEGDFSEREISLCREMGIRAVSLGEFRLRTETAAIALCIKANTINGLL